MLVFATLASLGIVVTLVTVEYVLIYTAEKSVSTGKYLLERQRQKKNCENEQ